MDPPTTRRTPRPPAVVLYTRECSTNTTRPTRGVPCSPGEYLSLIVKRVLDLVVRWATPAGECGGGAACKPRHTGERTTSTGERGSTHWSLPASVPQPRCRHLGLKTPRTQWTAPHTHRGVRLCRSQVPPSPGATRPCYARERGRLKCPACLGLAQEAHKWLSRWLRAWHTPHTHRARCKSTATTPLPMPAPAAVSVTP